MTDTKVVYEILDKHIRLNYNSRAEFGREVYVYFKEMSPWK